MMSTKTKTGTHAAQDWMVVTPDAQGKIPSTSEGFSFGCPAPPRKLFKITSRDGVDLGTYPAETPVGALDAMARDGGAESHADACVITTADPDDWTSDRGEFKHGGAELFVEEVENKAERLAVLRSEISERIAEVQRLIGPERAPMLYPAAQVVARECSRGFTEAGKPPSPVEVVIAKLRERAITGGWGEWFEVLEWAGVERCPYDFQTFKARALHDALVMSGVRVDDTMPGEPVRFRAPLARLK